VELVLLLTEQDQMGWLRRFHLQEKLRRVDRIRILVHQDWCKKTMANVRRLPLLRTGVVSDVDRAYAAGFFDGEGAVMIWRRAGKFNSIDKAGRPYHRLHVTISQTDRRPLEWLMERFGGTLCAKKRPRVENNEKPVWQLSLSSIAAQLFLESIYPFLVLKRERVDVALKFRQLVAINVKKGKKGWTAIDDELWAKREACRNELMALNKRGLAA